MRGTKNLWAMAALGALLASTVGAQTTGRIQGKVVDADGGALPGVTVTATSPNAIVNKVAVTEADGAFRFLNLAPGTYSVRAALEGFSQAQQDNVVVGIDRTATIELKLASEISETIQVTSEGPVVDVTSSESGLSVGKEVFENLPTQRNFYAVAQLAPGVGEDANGTTVSGSTSAENQYVIEGLNTTGVEVGVEGKQLNFDFIEEVEVKTGGLNAEYGRMTGGVINAVTKSGGNEFSGGVFAYSSDRADDKTLADRPETTTQIVEVADQFDYGFDLGGFIVKDKLWFFAAYNPTEQTNETTVVADLTAPGSPARGSVIDADIENEFYAAKLTWSLNANNTITASLFGDPSERTGNVFAIAGPSVTWNGLRETGSDDYVARYDGVFGGSWVIEGVLGRHQEEDFTSGPGKDQVQYIDQLNSPTVVSNGFGFHQDQEFQRDVTKLNVSKFLGNHEFKVGGDIEDVLAVNANYNGGAGQRIYVLRTSAATGGRTYYRHRFYIDDTAPGFDRNNPATWQLAVPLVSEPETTNTSWYAQDSWRLADNFTLSAGLRFERQEIKGRDGSTQIDIDDAYAPRLGMVWDALNNGRSKVYASYGRYYESVPMDINIRAFGGEVQCFCYNLSPNPADTAPIPNGSVPGVPRSNLLGGEEPVDPDLKGQYVDEYLLGFEYEVAPNFALGIQATYRDLGRVIEDFLQPDGNYFIANPGEGIGTEVTFYDYFYQDDFPVGYDFTAPAPKAEREYTAVTLTARKRFSDNWQLIASYVWSELEGNYDGAFQVSTGQLDPNINSAYDYADFTVNSQGKLSLDQTHTFKVDASYLFSEGVLDGLNVGASAYYRSGLPLNAYGYSFGYANNEFFLAPRGSLGRGPDDYEMDLSVSYPLDFGDSGVSVKLMLDVFNVLDRQAITRLDERYNRVEDGFGAGIPGDCFPPQEAGELCSTMGGIDHIEGTTNPVGEIQNIKENAPNPDYLQAGQAFTGPRTIRFGLKLNF